MWMYRETRRPLLFEKGFVEQGRDRCREQSLAVQRYKASSELNAGGPFQENDAYPAGYGVTS